MGPSPDNVKRFFSTLSTMCAVLCAEALKFPFSGTSGTYPNIIKQTDSDKKYAENWNSNTFEIHSTFPTTCATIVM